MWRKVRNAFPPMNKALGIAVIAVAANVVVWPFLAPHVAKLTAKIRGK